MPANLTPQYHKAEQVFKEAKTAEEKVAALEEMLAVIPKHKGTDHLQADLKRRLSKLKDEASKPKGGKKTFDPFRIEKSGAGQVLLLGAPNSGKSAVVARLSNAPTEATDFPFATQGPIPGMAAYEDAHIQLVDLPPITADYFPKGMLGLIKSCDGILLLADLNADSLLEDADAVLQTLEQGRVKLQDPTVKVEEEPDTKEKTAKGTEEDFEEEERIFPLWVELPTLCLATKIDLPGAADRLEIFKELYGKRFQPVPSSIVTGEGLEDLPKRLFTLLDRIRVYSKEPGKPPDMGQPFVLKRGQTILDLAAKIHRDFPEHLREARVWGSARFAGQAVHKDYVLVDQDVVELNVHL